MFKNISFHNNLKYLSLDLSSNKIGQNENEIKLIT